MVPGSSQTRTAAALGALLYVCAAVLVPVVHLAHHADTHVHGVAAAAIDVEAMRDARSGHVDLKRLARALGLDEAAHRQGASHRHGESSGGPLDHGAGSFEHFAIALLAGTIVALVPVSVAPPLPRPLPLVSQARVDRLVLLSTQRAQAPPA